MKIPLLLTLLALAAPALAQTPAAPVAGAPVAGAPVAGSPAAAAAETARPVEFDFNAEFDRLENKIVWRSVSLDGAVRNEFFVHNSGNRGVPLFETIQFLDAGQQPIAVLKVRFGADGKLAQQEFTTAAGAPLKQPVPHGEQPLQVDGSGISLQTFVGDGFLKRRVFTLKYPNWSGILSCDYDASGRRLKDVFASSTSPQPNTVFYQYDKKGLSRVVVSATDDNPETRVLMARQDNGQLREMRAIQDKNLVVVSTALRDDKGQLLGSRTENYREGALSDITELRMSTEGTSTTFTLTQSDPKGVMQRRQTQVNGITVSSENFQDGHVRERVDYNPQGEPQFVTRYNPDGKIEWKRPVGADGNLK